jgi:predicted transcriptional regulator
MPVPTIIHLPEDLKSRVDSAAERAGKTTGQLILEAIAEKMELEEQHADFNAEADARFARIIESGKTILWSEMRHYLQERSEGKSADRPVVKK